MPLQHFGQIKVRRVGGIVIVMDVGIRFVRQVVCAETDIADMELGVIFCDVQDVMGAGEGSLPRQLGQYRNLRFQDQAQQIIGMFTVQRRQ